MRLERLRQTKPIDHLASTAPIYKVSPKGEPQLVGSGFWATSRGHLVTAWHVIEDNIGDDGVDEGPIYAMQTLSDRQAVPRVLRKSCKHKTIDLALSETSAFGPNGDFPTIPHTMTLEAPPIGSRVYTYAYRPPDQGIPQLSDVLFTGTLWIPDLDALFQLTFMSRVSFGQVVEKFPEKRDEVMLPFPCFQTDMKIYGANSGGPVFDERGRICGINCTSYDGVPVSYHASLNGIETLVAREIEFVPEDAVPRRRSILEMALARRVLFDPPLDKVYIPFLWRAVLRPWHVYLWVECRLRSWKLQRIKKAGARFDESNKDADVSPDDA